MIEEEAYVAEVSEGLVWIEKNRRSPCSACAHECTSSLVSGLLGNKRVRLLVSSELPLQPGDKVLVGIPEEYLTLGSFWIYLLPLIGLFAGAIVGKSWDDSDLSSAVGGLIGLGLCYAGLKGSRIFDRQGYQAVILRKIG